MRMLIATDGSEFSKAAVRESCNLIQPQSTVVRIVSVHENVLPVTIEAMPMSPDYCQELENVLIQNANESVTEAADEIKRHFQGKSVTISTEVLSGFPDAAIIEEASRWKADLIIVGSHGRGFWGRLLGSVSTGLVHHAPCSVLVVRTPAMPSIALNT